MNNHSNIIKWATEYLISQEYSLLHSPEVILETPWSNVIRFSTSKGYIYLKQTPPAISAEPKIIQLLATQFQAPVPNILSINDELHCFLMKDAGQSLREFLKQNFQPKILRQAITEYSGIQRSTEVHIIPFFALGVPDWRLEKLPSMYTHIINQVDLLKCEGLTGEELQRLQNLSAHFLAQCESLAQYPIPATIAIYDFHTNNVLIDPATKKMTFIDLGESVITHPFLSLHTYLHQGTLHHPVTELDQVYSQLQEACLENWLTVLAKSKILEVFLLAKKLWPIYSVLSINRLIDIIGLQAYQTFYANRPNRIARFLREYIESARIP